MEIFHILLEIGFKEYWEYVTYFKSEKRDIKIIWKVINGFWISAEQEKYVI